MMILSLFWLSRRNFEQEHIISFHFIANDQRYGFFKQAETKFTQQLHVNFFVISEELL